MTILHSSLAARILAILWLAVLLAACVHHSRRGMQDWKFFRTAIHTHARRRFYLKWLFQSVLLFDLGGLVTLWLLPESLKPTSIVQLRLSAPATPASTTPTETSPAFFIGFACGLLIIAGVFILLRKLKRPALLNPLGNFSALIPRTLPEAGLAFLLCLNAGLGEELFFRLALPLLVGQLTGSLIAGAALSTLLFGGMHWYQGRKGVLITTIIGLIFMLRALHGTPLIWLMGLHALMDVIALFVRPVLTGHFNRSAVTPPAGQPLS
ncbi:CPBP family intramembrane glutamic endopeptidase [Gluconobacter sp. OJB]|uniref:CPBP family intramembrane glutamic endopeptidase n=1 Tax=Gluconobacter sp. OJB TaxID=3145196 RepID=UPI0031F8DD5C